MRRVKTIGRDGLGIEVAFCVERMPLGLTRTGWVQCMPPYTMNRCRMFTLGFVRFGFMLAVFTRGKVHGW